MIECEKKRGSCKNPSKSGRRTNGHVVRNYEAEGDDSGTPVI